MTTAWVTAHDLAADWGWMEIASGFIVRGGRACWEDADYPEHCDNGKVRISRIIIDEHGVRAARRYIDAATRISLVSRPQR